MSGYDAVNKTDASTHFAEDVYVYDLNLPQSAPLAYRSADGGWEQPDLLTLLGLSARRWRVYEHQLYSMPVCLSEQGGALVLPVFGGIGRFAIVIKPHISLPALAYLLAAQAFGKVYTDEGFAMIAPAMQARDRAAAERTVIAAAAVRLLISSCDSAGNAYQISECIALAAELWGVELMDEGTVEFPAMKGQDYLPEMKLSGQALFLALVTLISVMRNCAHARSGWLYALQDAECAVLHAVLRTSDEASADALVRLRSLLEQGGVVVASRSFEAPVKPPRQYAYMNRKITDPRHPLCARCGCLDGRCRQCTALQWAVLPYVCDAALLGIKNLPVFVPWGED